MHCKRMSKGDVFDLPFGLRANDVTRHIINIDSRFRTNPTSSSSSDFFYRLQNIVKNVLRIRITSIEFPNNYPIFTVKRRNVSLRFVTGAPALKQLIVEIPEGNYSAYDMQNQIITGLGTSGIQCVFIESSGKFKFTASVPFDIDTTWDTIDRPFDYGLGYYLGFSRKIHSATNVGGIYTLLSDQCANFAGDNYAFLKINEYDCVSQQTADETFTSLAKILLREPKNYMAFDDYSSRHVKEVIFPQPQDLTRFHIQILDAYGNVLDLCSSQISFSLEVLEIKNLSLYNSIRDSITLTYV